jgi:hypothetical protein
MLGSENQSSLDYIRYKAEKRARLLLASGGDAPVLDSDGGRNSIFTKAFIAALANNHEILSGPQLFNQVRKNVSAAAAKVGFKQVPEFKTIKGAGHEVGDFFFIPKSKS